MVTAHDLNDESSPRIRTYLPQFRAAPPPDPEAGDWRTWESLLASRGSSDPLADMTVVTGQGFGTVSSSLIALPAAPGPLDITPRRAIWRFAPGRPDRTDYEAITA
jgi:hypothetical protein